MLVPLYGNVGVPSKFYLLLTLDIVTNQIYRPMEISLHLLEVTQHLVSVIFLY